MRWVTVRNKAWAFKQQTLAGADSEVDSIGCSRGGPELGVQHPHSGSQPALTPGPGDLMPPSGLLGHQAHTLYTDIHMKGKQMILRTTLHPSLCLTFSPASRWTPGVAEPSVESQVPPLTCFQSRATSGTLPLTAICWTLARGIEEFPRRDRLV